MVGIRGWLGHGPLSMCNDSILDPRPSSYRAVNSYREFLVFYHQVSLGMFSPQGRHNATYTEHMPMNELHIALQLGGPWKAPCEQTPTTGSKRSPPVSPPGYFGCWYQHKLGTQTPNPPLTDQHYKDYTTTIGNKWTQLMPSD